MIAGLAQRLQDISTVPTWCPNWESKDPLPFATRTTPEVYGAAGSTAPKMTLGYDNGTLHVQGYVIDSVQQVTPIVTGGHLRKDGSSLNVEVIKTMRTFAPKNMPTIAEFKELTQPYSGSLATSQNLLLNGPVMDQYEKILRVVRFPTELAHREGTEAASSMMAQVIHETEFDFIFANRRFCVTDQGYLGVVHEETRAGDLVTVIDGVCVPILLREIMGKPGT